jgi:hypothetical protein
LSAPFFLHPSCPTFLIFFLTPLRSLLFVSLSPSLSPIPSFSLFPPFLHSFRLPSFMSS